MRQDLAPVGRSRAEHHSLLDVRAPVECVLEGPVQLGQRHLGEKSEAAEVHAENRYAGARIGNAVSHADQRPVASEHQHHVDVGREGRLVQDGPALRRRHERARSPSHTPAARPAP